jgi:membrane protease YdiL (CAAX protease family)
MTALSATGWALGATFLFYLAAGILAALRPGSERDTVSNVGCQAIAYLVTLFLILLVHAPEAGVRDFVGMRPTHALFYPLAIALGLSLQAPANALFTVIERRWPSHVEDAIPAAFQAASSPKKAAIALAVILVGPMLEEVIFRGALFRAMLRSHSVPVVIAVTATLFGLAHLAPQVALPIAIVGLCLGFLRRASGSLVPTMLLHATFNAVPFYAMAARKPGTPETDTPIDPKVVLVSSAAALILLGFVHLVGLRSEEAKAAQEFDRQ